MNILGYLVTLSNMQYFTGMNGPPISDISVRIDEVKKLADVLLKNADFPPEAFRANGFYKVGNIGTYVSVNLKDFLYGTGPVDPKDKGLILTVTFRDTKNSHGNNGVITLNKSEPIPLNTNQSVNFMKYFSRKKRDIEAF